MASSTQLRFEVLGPLEVRLDGSAVQLGGVKQRLVLAVLLVHSNAVVSLDRLSDVLWGDDPPAEAATTLAKYVYRLRTAFGAVNASSLATRQPGYMLSVAPDQLDAARFAALVSDARRLLVDEPARALMLLDDALALWHGPAWAEFADYQFVRADVARLDGLRAMATEARADALLALGRYDELIPVLEAAIGEHPLRERPRAQLMLALYLGGRQADALSAYQRFRRYLLDEVGLEPSPRLRELENDILQQRPHLEVRHQLATVGTTRVHAADFAGAEERFVGRRADLDWLEVLFAQAVAGGHPVIGLVGGSAGMGKTSLLRTFGRLAQAHGAEVIFARCDKVLGAAGSLLETVRSATASSESGTRSDDVSLSVVDDALASLDAPRLLLVLDDLDAAGDDAWLLLEHFASTRYAAALCVVGTARGTADYQIRGQVTMARRVLAGLKPAEVAELLALVSGASRAPAVVDSICAETAGVPAVITELGHRLRDVDIAERADRALTRAEAARRGLRDVRKDVAHGVLARRERRKALSPPPSERDTDATDAVVCPYKGLAPFGVSDAAYFCGRERLVAELVARLAVDRFVGIVGASGSGKSSLVAAGLLPALASGALPGSERWLSTVIRPGAHPVHELANAFARLVDEPVSSVRERLDSEPRELEELAHRVPQSQPVGGERLVLAVDQFEEVFTACSDTAERDRFITALVAGPAPADSPLAVTVIIRADYYGACAEHPELARLLEQSQLLVAAMTDTNLRQAVQEPARRVGLTVEDGLAEAICADAAGEPGALALVSTALLETWVRRSGNTLTLAGYAQAGGVRGAVAQLAEGVYDSLDPADKPVLRRILLRLADPEGATDDVRRRAPGGEIASDPAERRVLAELINCRLVTATEDSVEVAHEALLREWPRLRAWLEEDRDGRRLHRRLADAATAWHAEGRDDAGLYRGVRLQTARDWAFAHPGDANRLEQQFLTASTAAQERRLHSARRTARRLRGLAVGLAALLAVAVAAGAFAAVQRSQARRLSALAHARALQAETNRLATLARTLPDDERSLALLLGVEGYRIQPSDDTAGGLQAAVVQTPPGLQRIISYHAATVFPHLDRAGRLLAVAGQDGTVTIDDVATGQVLHTFKWPRPREFAVLSGDDKLIAAGGYDGRIAIWDTHTGRLSGAPLTVGGGTARALFDPTNATRMYAITDPGQLTTWDRHDPKHPHQIGGPFGYAGGQAPNGNPPYMTISPNGQLIAAGDPQDPYTPVVWDAHTGKPLASLQGGLGNFAADNVTLPIGLDNAIRLDNARTGRLEGTVPTPYGSWPLAVLSPDGRRLAVPEHGHDMIVYDVATGHAIGEPLRLQATSAIPVGFLPNGQLVTSGSTDAGIWAIGQALPPVGVALPAPNGPDDTSATIFLSGADEVITRGYRGQLLRHDPKTGATLGPLLTDDLRAPVVASLDGRFLAGASAHLDATAIWDRTTGQPVGRLADIPAGANLAWSPTGQLLATDLGPAVQLWNVADPTRPTLIASVPNPEGVARPDYLLFSQDGRTVVTAAAEDKRVTVINVAPPHVRWSTIVPDSALRQVAISPNGKTIAVDSGDASTGRVTLYNAATGARGRSITTPSYGGLGYLRGGDWLIVTNGSTQPGAQLYDATTLEPIGVPFPTTGPSDGDPIAVNTTGTMFSEAEQDTPRLWDADVTHWQTIACRIAGRNLTRAEWHQYLPSRPYHRTCQQWPAGQ
jgi:DNA-binding SARP family transcriptional activator/WD40 repeat protein